MYSIPEKIIDILDNFTREYMELHNISLDDDDVELGDVEVFHIGDSGMFLIIYYGDDSIGSVLWFRDEVTVTSYYTKKDKAKAH
jgi:hypothetical protein